MPGSPEGSAFGARVIAGQAAVGITRTDPSQPSASVARIVTSDGDASVSVPAIVAVAGSQVSGAVSAPDAEKT